MAGGGTAGPSGCPDCALMSFSHSSKLGAGDEDAAVAVAGGPIAGVHEGVHAAVGAFVVEAGTAEVAALIELERGGDVLVGGVAAHVVVAAGEAHVGRPAAAFERGEDGVAYPEELPSSSDLSALSSKSSQR